MARLRQWILLIDHWPMSTKKVMTDLWVCRVIYWRVFHGSSTIRSLKAYLSFGREHTIRHRNRGGGREGGLFGIQGSLKPIDVHPLVVFVLCDECVSALYRPMLRRRTGSLYHVLQACKVFLI